MKIRKIWAGGDAFRRLPYEEVLRTFSETKLCFLLK